MLAEAPSPVPALAALADETRWSVLVALGEQPASASALAERLPVSRQAIAKHLEVLERVGLVSAERHGRSLVYRAEGARLSSVARELEAVGRAWDRRLARIKALAED